MQTPFITRSTAALAFGCAVAFLAAGCTASVETHTIDAAGNTTTHVSKTWGGETVTPTQEAPLELTGEDAATTETPKPAPTKAEVPKPAPVETTVEVVEPEITCVPRAREVLVASGAVTEDEVALLSDAEFEELIIASVLEEQGITPAQFCAKVNSPGVLEEMAAAQEEEKAAEQAESSAVPCLPKLKEVLLADGDVTEAELAAMPDAVLEQLFIAAAEVEGVPMSVFCAMADSGMLDETELAADGKSYESVADLRTDLVAAGLACEDPSSDDDAEAKAVADELSAEIGGPVEGMFCSDSDGWPTAALWVFDPTGRDHLMEESAGNLAEGTAMLFGPNWALSAGEEDVAALHPALGGELVAE